MCGRDNTDHLAKLGLIEAPEPVAPPQESQNADEALLDNSPEAKAREKAIKAAQKLRGKVPAAPHVPAPLKVALPRPDRFEAVAGGIVGSHTAVVEDLEGFDVDRTPTWFYKLILFISILGYSGAFLYWNSTSPIIGPGWKLWAFVLMVFFAVIALIVAFRLGRKEEYGARGVAFARRRRDGAVRMVKEAAQGVASAGKGIAQSGTNFGEGFQGTGKPNFIVRFIQWIIRTITRIILGVLSLVKTVFALVLGVWILAVRIGWWLYRGIVEPVFRLAFRIVRWALKVTYRVFRWALRVVWRTFYWLMRRFPFKYVTRMLENPVRFHVEPRVLVANVIISDALGAPLKERVSVPAKPHVEAFRLDHQTNRAIKLLENERAYHEERPLWLTVPTPQERRERAEEKKRLAADHKARAKQAELDAKAAHKEALKRHKEELKAAKAEGRADEVKAKLAAEKAAAKDRLKAEKAAAKGKAPKAGKADKLAAKEEKRAEKEAKKAEKAAAKEAKQQEKPKSKTEKKAAKKAEKKAEKEQAKKDKKAAEERLKADKKKDKPKKKGKKGKTDADDTAPEIRDDAATS